MIYLLTAVITAQFYAIWYLFREVKRGHLEVYVAQKALLRAERPDVAAIAAPKPVEEREPAPVPLWR